MTNMDNRPDSIEKRYWKYLRQGVSLCAALFFLLLLVASQYPSLVLPLAVSAAYALVVEVADAIAWRKVAAGSPDSMPTFFMAVSGLRFMVALVVMFVYFLLAGKTGKADMGTFILIFALFYVAVLLHHTLFFARRRKNCTRE